MPIKEVTETQLLRLLGNTPLQVEADFIYTESYVPTHTSRAYLSEFYGTFAEVRHKKYDGFIITGAPVEQYAFEEVAYWDEVAEIMQWSKKISNLTALLKSSTMSLIGKKKPSF